MTALLACAALLLAACGSSPGTSVDAAVPPEPDAVVRAPAPDLRFQWVGASERFVQHVRTNLGLQLSGGDSVWGPLSLATQEDVPGWEVTDFGPAEPTEPMDSLALGRELADLGTELDQLAAQGYVITSLDVTADGYAVIASAPVSRTPSYAAHATITDRAGLTAFAAAQAQLSRVVTAVSGDGLRA